MIIEFIKTYRFKDYHEASEIAFELSDSDYICHLEHKENRVFLHVYKDIW